MRAVLLVGHGGFEKLQFRDDIPVPRPGPGEVLIKVAAAGINNTDINTRIGWYSKTIKSATEDTEIAETSNDAGWLGAPLSFPRIQGADCCGRIVAVGADVPPARIGERVIVRNLLRTYVDCRAWQCWTFGSECDGAFAQFAKAPSRETYPVDCGWSDVELASIPCAWSTAEGMLHRAQVARDERVLVTGASGGVGSAAVQLARRRGARVAAVAAAGKAAEVRAQGADVVVARGDNLIVKLGRDTVDVVIDVVAGPSFGELIDVLRRGGRYAVAGAIAGPMVDLDVRSLSKRTGGKLVLVIPQNA
jgi:NADPH:quinone reductase-like Zn-dependent oxidoreductase